MRKTSLVTSLAVAAKVVAVLFWVFLVGISVIPVAVDQTGIFGAPHLHGNRLIPGDFGQLPTDCSPASRMRGGLLAGATLLLIVLAVCPHRFLARHDLLLWPVVVISTLPAIAATYVFLPDLLTNKFPAWWSLQDSLFLAVGVAMLEIALLALPASLVLNRILLSPDRALRPSEPR